MEPIRFGQVVLAVSDMLDLVGVDDLHHSKRVALMCLDVGQQLGWSAAELEVLYHAALLHDIGVSSTQVHRNLVNELDWAGAGEHCEQGAALLNQQPDFAHLAPYVLYHHTHWDALQGEHLPPDVPRLANCIYLTDRADALFSQRENRPPLAQADQVRAILADYGQTFFDPQLLQAFLDVSRCERFWLDLLPQHMNEHLGEWAQTDRDRFINVQGLRQLAHLAAYIVDAKSRYTADHSTGVAGLSAHLAERLGLDLETIQMIEVAGWLHDIGKLAVPDEILEKPGRLTEDERAVMRSHSFDTHRILSRLEGFQQISCWAGYHHETLDGQGYPFHLQDADLCPEARLVAVADIFQALGQVRPYRQPSTPTQVLELLDQRARKGKLDDGIVSLLHQDPAACWHAAHLGAAPIPTAI